MNLLNEDLVTAQVSDRLRVAERAWRTHRLLQARRPRRRADLATTRRNHRRDP